MAGFSTGLRTGAGLVQQVLDNERRSVLDARETEKYERAKKDQDAVDAAVADVKWPGDTTAVPATAAPAAPAAGLPAAPAAGLPAAPAAGLPSAPPTSVAATGGTGVPPTPPVGQQMEAAAAGAVAPAASAEGLRTGSPVTPPAAEAPPAPAAPALSPEKKLAQSLFNVAKAKKDVAGMNAAVDQYHVAARKEIVNDAAKMNDNEAWDYVHQNVNKVGSLPMSIVKEGKDGYRVTAWSEDGKGASMLLDSSGVKKLVAADKLMKTGYGAEGLELAGSVNKDLNAIIKDYNAGTNQQVATGNAVTSNRITQAETARSHRANEGNAAAGLNLRRDAAAREKFQNADTWQDKDGNTYKSVLEVGKNGPQMRAFKIGGEDGSLQPINALPPGLKKVGGAGGASAAPKAIPAAGTMMQDSEGNKWQEDGKGGRVSVTAPLPEARAGVLKKAGLSGGEAAKVTWTPDGEHVTFAGSPVGYNVNDPNDMAQLQADMNSAATERTMANETAARVAGAPARRAQRTQQMDNLSNPNRFGPGAGLDLQVPRDRRDLYINTDQ